MNFYKHNELVISKKNIKRIEEYYKNNYAQIDNWNDFSSPVQEILSQSTLVENYYKTQYNAQKALQGGKILEFICVETLSKMLNKDGVKFEIISTGEQGKGSGDTFDIQILDVSTGEIYIGEVKDEMSRTGDTDLRYDEKGKLYPSPGSKKWNESYRPFLDGFNAVKNFFEVLDGSGNFSIAKHKDICCQVVKNYFKGADFLFTCREDKLVTIPLKKFESVESLFDFKGSEIRRLGRNGVKIYTPGYLKAKIEERGYFKEEDKNYIVPKDKLERMKGRGKVESSNFRVIPGFIIDIKYITETGEFYIFPKDKIKQLNTNISVHLTLKASYSELEELFGGENNAFFN